MSDAPAESLGDKINGYVAEAEAAANALIAIFDPALAAPAHVVEAAASSAINIATNLYNTVKGFSTGQAESWDQVSAGVKQSLADFESLFAA